MAPWTTDYRRIPERPGPGRLGRHVKRDSRALAYPYQLTRAALVAVTWARHIPILDQGSAGSCTGNAGCGALGTDPIFGGLPAAHPALDETLAVRIYSEAELIDGDGPYPPNDNGSCGQSACQAAKNDGWISGYTWCQDLAGCLDALQHGPVLLGVNWYSSFDSPPASGVVSLPARAYVRGGHEIVARQYDAAAGLIWFDNSWGPSYGVAGRAAFPEEILARLFTEDGDCAVPLPATAPAPAPVPVPPAPSEIRVDAADRALAAAIPPGWAAARHAGSNAKAAKAVAAWEAAKGLLGLDDRKAGR